MPDDDYNTYRLKYEPDWNQAGEEVGQGGFGVVFTHKIRRPGMLRHELCAVKRYRWPSWGVSCRGGGG